MTSFYNFFLVDKAGFQRLALLTFATVFMSGFTLPLTIKTQLPAAQEYTPDAFTADAKLILKEWRDAVVRDKLFYKDSIRFFETREKYVGRLRTKATYLAEQATAAVATAQDKRSLFLVQVGFAAALASVYLLALALKQTRVTIEYVVPLVISGTIIWKSLESGATTAMLLATLIAVLGFIAKMISDNRRTDVTWPRFEKALLAFFAIFPLVMTPLVLLFIIGNWIDDYITRGILSTEATLLFGVDEASTAFDDLTTRRSAWLDPMEWFVWRPIRRTAREVGGPTIAYSGMGIRLTYSCLRALLSVLQVASLISFVWLLIRVCAFVACRSVLYGGGGFVFRLPPPSDEVGQRAAKEYA